MLGLRIAILGTGNLGFAITEGLLAGGLVKREDLYLTEKNPTRRDHLSELGYRVTEDNAQAVKDADLVMLVVKPWQIEALLQEIRESVDAARNILVSCVTGADSNLIYTALGKTPPLFRVMPNTAIAIGQSMSLISSFNATEEQRETVNRIFSQLGQVLFIAEDLMAAATVLSGCGIAYALRFIRAVIQGGIEIGFNADDAKIIAAQIAKGAAELILRHGTHPESEIDKVTTPKGVTITGLNEMEHAGFSSAIIRGILASYNKIGR